MELRVRAAREPVVPMLQTLEVVSVQGVSATGHSALVLEDSRDLVQPVELKIEQARGQLRQLIHAPPFDHCDFVTVVAHDGDGFYCGSSCGDGSCFCQIGCSASGILVSALLRNPLGRPPQQVDASPRLQTFCSAFQLVPSNR